MNDHKNCGDKPWKTEIVIDERLVSAALSSDFPDLDVQSISFLGEGWNSSAFLVNEDLVFRFPKREDVEQKLDKELKLLPRLQEQLPVAIPQLAFATRSPAHFPFIYAGHKKLDGFFGWNTSNEALHPEALARSVAETLSALHQFPRGEALALGCEEEYASLDETYCAELMEEFARIGDCPVCAEFEPQLKSYIDSVVPSTFGEPQQLTVAHTDLLPDHLLLEPSLSKVCGIIDWGEIKIADPAEDFAGLYYWLGRDFVEAILEYYDQPLDSSILDRARLIALRVGIGDVWYGIDANLPRYLKVGKDCLNHCLR